MFLYLKLLNRNWDKNNVKVLQMDASQQKKKLAIMEEYFLLYVGLDASNY